MMSELEINNILHCASEYKNMCISIDIFIEFLKPPLSKYFTQNKLNESLRSGFYGKLLNCKVWVKKIEDKCIKISDENDIDYYENATWTPPIPIQYANQIDKMLELKSFW
jgi:hypothetical protein